MELSSSCPYSLLSEQMTRGGIAVSPADAHGLACALIVTSTPDSRLVWERELLSDVDTDASVDPTLYALLQQQFAELEVGIESPDCSVSLCLPDEDVALAERVAGLRDWCHGFLFGMGFTGQQRLDGLRDDAEEALRDFADFTRLDADGAGTDPTDEASLTVLEEYVRVAVLLIKEDLHAQAGDNV